LSKGSKAPSAPDPAATAQAQAEANRITQFTPQGTMLYGKVGPGGQFVQDTGGAASYLQQTPFQQQTQQQYETIASGLAGALAPNAANLQSASYAGQPGYQYQIDWSKVGKVPGAEDFSADATRVEQATFDRAKGLLAPEFERQTRQTTQRLADQGLPMGSEAYTGEQNRLADTQNRAYSDAALAAVEAGRAEQSRLYNQALTSRGTQLSDQLTGMQLTNQARQQGFGEQQAVRNQQLQELAALLGGSYNPTPGTSYVAPGQIDVAGPINQAYQGQLLNWQQRQANQAAGLGGLYSLGGAALMGGYL
jgi:hypothetical protein